VVSSFVDVQNERLQWFLYEVPDKNQPDVLYVIDQLQHVRRRVDGLSANITCPSRGIDDWGPIPGKC
jgi:hypothetical protein